MHLLLSPAEVCSRKRFAATELSVDWCHGGGYWLLFYESIEYQYVEVAFAEVACATAHSNWPAHETLNRLQFRRAGGRKSLKALDR